MKRASLACIATATAAAALSGVFPAAALATGHVHHAAHGSASRAHSFASSSALTTKTPYRPEGRPGSYLRPPSGYHPVFTENVSRHGARTLSNSDEGDALLALWELAQTQHALTPRGRSLGPEIQRLLAANAEVGYGLLTGSGKRELETTASRLHRRLPQLFDRAVRTSKRSATPTTDVLASSQQRTVDSANDFVDGLDSADPRIGDAVAPLRTDDDLLYFHKAAANADYQGYVKNDPRVAAAEAKVRTAPRTRTVASDVLEHSFTPAFVKGVADGDYRDEFADEIDAAQAVYDLWAVTADMKAEGPWHMQRYLSPRDADWFGYLDDVTSFYENGPAFAGDDITYRMAGVLLDDMFAQLNAKRDGTSKLDAVLRFTHAEEVFPLAALLQLPGSTKQLPAGTLFTYADDPFRGAQVAPMAANIQWDLFQRNGAYLVRMLYNEKQTAFKASCAPVHPGSDFYRLNELERCYAQPRS